MFKRCPSKVRGKTFLRWTRSIDLSSYPLTIPSYVGVMLTISSSYSYSACGNRKHPGNFQNKSVNSPFNWVSRYILLLPKLKGKERPFWKGATVKRRGTTLQDHNLVEIRHEKVSPSVKFEIIPPLLCFFTRPPHK